MGGKEQNCELYSVCPILPPQKNWLPVSVRQTRSLRIALTWVNSPEREEWRPPGGEGRIAPRFESSLQRICPETMWLLLPGCPLSEHEREFPVPPHRDHPACSLLNIRSPHFLGWDILMNMQPMKASTMEPRMDWNRKRMMPSRALVGDVAVAIADGGLSLDEEEGRRSYRHWPRRACSCRRGLCSGRPECRRSPTTWTPWRARPL